MISRFFVSNNDKKQSLLFQRKRNLHEKRQRLAIDCRATCGDFSFVEMTKMRVKHRNFKKKISAIRGRKKT